jgi:hypothetical protein
MKTTPRTRTQTPLAAVACGLAAAALAFGAAPAARAQDAPAALPAQPQPVEPDATGRLAPADPSPLEITRFDVAPVARIEPGAQLEFTLEGTPGAQAMLAIGGARNVLLLDEIAPGLYRGVYTVAVGEPISAGSAVQAHLRAGYEMRSVRLDEPLQTPPVGAAATPQISRFSITHGATPQAGDLVHLRVLGTPGATVSVYVAGRASEWMVLPESRPGDYNGSFTIDGADRLGAGVEAIARLRVGARTATATLAGAYDPSLAAAAPEADAAYARSDVDCDACATVVAISQVEVQPSAAAGPSAAPALHYEVVVQRKDALRLVLVLAQPPALRVGDFVRLDDARAPSQG